MSTITVKTAAEQARDEAVAAIDAIGASVADAQAAATAAQVAQAAVAADEANVEELTLEATGAAELAARSAGMTEGKYYTTTAKAQSNGVVKLTILNAGDDGASGDYDFIATGGLGGAGFAGRFKVVSGQVVDAVITASGDTYGEAPVLSTANCVGLAGAAVVATVGQNQPPGTFYFITPAAGANAAYDIYENVGGVATLRGSVANPSVANLHNLTGAVGSGTGSTTYDVAGPSTFTTLSNITMAILVPDIANDGNVTVRVTPSGGGVFSFSLLTATNAQVPKGLLKPGAKYLIVGDNSAAARVVAMIPDAILATMSLLRSGVVTASLSTSSLGNLIFSSTDGAGTNREVMRCESNGDVRNSVGGFRRGVTTALSEEYFWRKNPQAFVSDVGNETATRWLIDQATPATWALDTSPISLVTASPPYYLNSLNTHAPIIVKGVDKWLDARFMGNGDVVSITVNSSQSCHVYIGVGATFLGQAAGNITANISGSAAIFIKRDSAVSFVIWAVVGSITYSTTPRPIANKSLLLLGQSFMELWSVSGGLFGFQEKLADLGITDDFYIISTSLGSTSLLKGNTNVANGWWWDQTLSGGLGGLGPMSTATVTAVAAACDATPTGLGQPEPQIAFSDLGQNDSLFIGIANGIGFTTTFDNFYPAYVSWLTALRTQTHMINIKIVVTPTGGSDSGILQSGYATVRAGQVRAIRGDGLSYLGPMTYDLYRPTNNLHAGYKGFSEEGRRYAMVLDNALYAGTNLMGPFLSGETEVTANSRYVDVVPNDPSASSFLNNLFAAPNPVNPQGFTVTSPTDPHNAVVRTIERIDRSIVGTSTRLTFTLTDGVVGDKIRFPSGAMFPLGIRRWPFNLSQLPLQPLDNY